MADHHRAGLPVAALRMAAGRGGLEQGCVMHTDRSSEYTSDEFRSEIRRLRMRQSLGRVGSCYENAAAESWFAILKAEIGTTMWETREAPGPTFSATSRSSTTAAGSVGIPTTGTSPRSKRDPCSGRTSSRQRKHPLSSSRGELQRRPPPSARPSASTRRPARRPKPAAPACRRSRAAAAASRSPGASPGQAAASKSSPRTPTAAGRLVSERQAARTPKAPGQSESGSATVTSARTPSTSMSSASPVANSAASR
ncbi:DDE-type integrase/transposase/recombinase [Streptomyces broussonetiae]|uniref:DDE-type integrase/transposase/recombinase n=1 Tax=Streptomyces broussonetiae TaxID=2686304 RepID=A0A6I6NB49_9ACTN|nr:DDE-type integrase/transposase/recombinase [Streptomyces broussonetiae]